MPTPDDLVPRALKQVSLQQFFRGLPAFDKEWADRAERERRGTRAAIRRHGDAAGRFGKAGRGSSVEPDGVAQARAT